MALNLQNVKLEITAGMINQFPVNNMPHIVFSGRSNVGKSSLINSLLNRNRLARVSSSPGKTITINFYNVDSKFYFVDLPGYGFAKRPPEHKKKWRKLVDDYLSVFAENISSMLVVQLIDLKVGPTADDIMMLEWLAATDTDYIIAATKSDKLNQTQKKACLEKLKAFDGIRKDTAVIPFSALKNEGKNEIWSAINAKI